MILAIFYYFSDDAKNIDMILKIINCLTLEQILNDYINFTYRITNIIQKIRNGEYTNETFFLNIINKIFNSNISKKNGIILCKEILKTNETLNAILNDYTSIEYKKYIGKYLLELENIREYEKNIPKIMEFLCKWKNF